MRSLFKTSNSFAPTILRLVLGFLFFLHGTQKALGWFGGYGFSKTLDSFHSYLGIPAPFTILASAAEFLGGIGLIVGLLSRVAAFGIFCTMIVAAWKVNLANGIFMNWAGTQKGEGYEFHLLVIAVTLAIMVLGSGALSLDRIVGQGRALPSLRSPKSPRPVAGSTGPPLPAPRSSPETKRFACPLPP
jgi:putative oxidoreductase